MHGFQRFLKLCCAMGQQCRGNEATRNLKRKIKKNCPLQTDVAEETLRSIGNADQCCRDGADSDLRLHPDRHPLFVIRQPDIEIALPVEDAL